MDYAVIGVLTAQFTVLCGIFMRLGGMHEAITNLKQRVTRLEKHHGLVNQKTI